MSARAQGSQIWLSVLYWKQNTREKNTHRQPGSRKNKDGRVARRVGAGSWKTRSERGHASTKGKCWSDFITRFWENKGRYHGGRRLSSDDSFHSPTVIPPSALDKLSTVKLYHRRRTTRRGVTTRSLTLVTLHDARFVECRW